MIWDCSAAPSSLASANPARSNRLHAGLIIRSKEAALVAHELRGILERCGARRFGGGQVLPRDHHGRDLIPRAVRGSKPFVGSAEDIATACIDYSQLDIAGAPMRLRLNTTVALRDWRAFANLKVHGVYAPGSYQTEFRLNPHVNIGAYRSTKTPSDPILVQMVRTPCKAGLSEHEQNRAGRAELLNPSFETFERNIRDQLGRTLRDGGFDPARNITAITVNRWPYTDSAINQGCRAVMELLKISAA